jgi:hypothetical protein
MANTWTRQEDWRMESYQIRFIKPFLHPMVQTLQCNVCKRFRQLRLKGLYSPDLVSPVL